MSNSKDTSTNHIYPKEPLLRIIQEGRFGTCPVCHSSEVYTIEPGILYFGKPKGCIQPMCERYYKKPKDT